MDSRIVKLGEWGCDIGATLERMLGDEEFYLDCLNTIRDEDDFDNLYNQLKAGKTTEAFDTAHKLKGLLANLGLIPMYDKVVEIVEPLRKGNADNLIEKCQELFVLKDKLISILG